MTRGLNRRIQAASAIGRVGNRPEASGLAQDRIVVFVDDRKRPKIQPLSIRRWPCILASSGPASSLNSVKVSRSC